MTDAGTAESAHPLRVGTIGSAFLAAGPAQAWRNAHRFSPLPMTPELTVDADLCIPGDSHRELARQQSVRTAVPD